jgi:hypothetical protein
LSSRKVYKYKTKTKTKIRTTILNLNIDEDESCKMNNNNNNNKAMSDAELKTFIKQRNINVLSIHHKYEPSVERSCDFCNYVLRLCWLCNQCESCCLYNIDDLECKEK